MRKVIFSILLFVFFKHTLAGDGVLWSNREDFKLEPIGNLLKSADQQNPLALFFINGEFRLADFSRLGELLLVSFFQRTYRKRPNFIDNPNSFRQWQIFLTPPYFFLDIFEYFLIIFQIFWAIIRPFSKFLYRTCPSVFPLNSRALLSL